MQNKTTTTDFFIGEAELVVELVLQSRCGSCGSPHVMTTICNERTGIVIDYTCTKGHAKVWKSATRLPGDVLPKADKIMCAAEVFAKGGYTHLENFLGRMEHFIPLAKLLAVTCSKRTICAKASSGLSTWT